MNKTKYPLFFLAITLSLATYSQQENGFNCFTILVGKNATIDGSVIIAHNEDNSGETFADWHKVPRIKHRAGSYQQFLSGDSIAEISETNAYLWITVSQYNAEQYLNEWGVTITTDASRSNEKDAEGRIGQCLRRIMAERSHSAREAVKLAGSLIEKYGYSMSGRIYSVADPNEAWVLEVVNGKHWISERVPDNEVALVPNYYVIQNVDLTDTLNFLASPDIIDYAVQQGWYNPESGGSFNFRQAYCRQDRLYSMTNIARRWSALNLLSDKQYGIYDNFPFSFKPKQKLDIQELMLVLQNHYEGTEFEMNPAYNHGDPHNNTTTMRICSKYNTFSTVVQLRSWMPVDIGCVMWIAPRFPCMQPYVPWYYGITKIPTGYENESYEVALDNYLVKDRNLRELFPNAAYWVFLDVANKTLENYGEKIGSLKRSKQKFQSKEFKTVSEKEQEILHTYQTNPETAQRMLTDVTGLFAERALDMTKKRLKK